VLLFFFKFWAGPPADEAAASENDDVHGFSLWWC